MKNLLTILTIALMMTTTSCVEFPDLPDGEISLIVRNVDITVIFDNENHGAVPLDINDNGTTDFLFVTNQIADPQWGEANIVGLMAANMGNGSIVKTTSPDILCGLPIPLPPGQTLGSNVIINSGSHWNADALFYGNVMMNDGCNGYRKYIDYGQDRFIGIQFKENDETIYGWIKLRANDTISDGYSDCAEEWKILQYGYSATADSGLRTPA